MSNSVNVYEYVGFITFNIEAKIVDSTIFGYNNRRVKYSAI